MALRAAEGDEDALGGSPRINDLDRVFNGAGAEKVTDMAESLTPASRVRLRPAILRRAVLGSKSTHQMPRRGG